MPPEITLSRMSMNRSGRLMSWSSKTRMVPSLSTMYMFWSPSPLRIIAGRGMSSVTNSRMKPLSAVAAGAVSVVAVVVTTSVEAAVSSVASGSGPPPQAAAMREKAMRERANRECIPEL